MRGKGLRFALPVSSALLLTLPAAAWAQSGPFLYVPTDSGTVEVIDTSINLVTGATFHAGTLSYWAAVTGDGSVAYVTNSGSNNVTPINSPNYTPGTPIAVGNNPLGVAVTPDGKTLYVANNNDNTVTPINTVTNTAGTPIAVGSQPWGVAVSPDGKTVYVTNAGNGTVTPINTATNTAGTPIAVQNNPIGIVVSPDGNTVYVANNSSTSVTVISTATNTAIKTIVVGGGPAGIAITPDGKTVYVVNVADSTVTPINTATNTAGTPIAVGSIPFGVAVSRDGKTVYVTTAGGKTVTPIDTATNTVGTPILMGSIPNFPGICSNGNALLASGLTFKAYTPGALACTLASGPAGAPGPVFTGGTLQLAGGSMTITLPVSVQSAGGTIDTLGGTVTLANTLSGPGPLTVHGSLAFTSGAQWLVSINGASASRINVTGTATLGGASVAIANGSLLINGQRYTILTASGGIIGTFNPAVGGAPHATLSYDANDVFLSVFYNIRPLLPPGAPVNPTNVAAAIDSFINAGGTLPAGFQSLFNLTPQQLIGALTQASGETATATQQTTFDAMNLFMGVMTDPSIDGRGSGPGTASGAPAFAEESNQSNAYAADRHKRRSAERDVYAMFKAPPPAPFEPRWSVWAAGFGGSQTTDGNAAQGSSAATSRIFGTAVGADYHFSPVTLAGFALAGGGTNFSVSNFGSGRSDLFQAGAYVRHMAGPAYIAAALAYGWQDITTSRTLMIAGIDQLQARFNANAWSGRFEGGYRLIAPWTGGIGITPYGAAQFTTFDLPAYAESVLSGANTFALAYGSKSVTDARSEFGIRTDKSYAMPESVLTLRGRFAWAHDYNPDRSIGATFQALPGASFVVGGAAQAGDAALTTASIERK